MVNQLSQQSAHNISVTQNKERLIIYLKYKISFNVNYCIFMNSNTVILLSGLFVQRFNVDAEKLSSTNVGRTLSESVKKTIIASVYSHINCLLGHCSV